MNYFQHFKFLTNLIRHKLYGYRFPAHVAICVTNKCNLKCPYCFYRYNLNQEDKISTQTMLSLIDELHNRGTAYVNLNGGEPLLRKDIKTIIDYITIDKGMRCSISTNAVLLEERIQDLKNVSVITISLDGNEDEHRRNRGDLSYEKVVSGIDAARRNNISVAICTVLTRNNKDCVDEIAKFSKEKGIFSIFHFLYERLNKQTGQEINSLSREEEKEIMQKIINYKKSGYPIHYTYKVHKYIRDWPCKGRRIIKEEDDLPKENFKIIPCLAGDLFCYIDAVGSVWPCAVLSGQVESLSFLETGFKKAWDLVPKTRCKTCSFFHQVELNLLLSLNLKGWFELITSKFVKS